MNEDSTLPNVSRPLSWLLVVVAMLVLVNASTLFIPSRDSWVLALVNFCALAIIAKVSGLSMADLGLSRKNVKNGVVSGLTILGFIIVVFAIVYLFLPRVFMDTRYDIGITRMLIIALIAIPFHTVLVEELAFRGVLWASMRRYKGIPFATIWSSVLFALWHVVSSLGLGNSSVVLSNGLSGVGIYRVILPIFGVMVVTFVAGIGFCELRVRSNSLVAPIFAHWAINGTAVMMAYLAWHR